MINNLIAQYMAQTETNYVTEFEALAPDLVGMRLFDNPLIGYAAADDDLFTIHQTDPLISHGLFELPNWWLADARTVVSFFFPFTDQIKAANSRDMNWPANEWLHGRIEGQKFINGLMNYLVAEMRNKGYSSIAPTRDPRFKSQTGHKGTASGRDSNCAYGSNWSERHTAFIAGLGTFGLSKGLITAKGIAGRFGSIITSYDHPANHRAYQDPYEYCNMCGACAPHCPPQAITVTEGKNHSKCDQFIDRILNKHRPYYGCGKCQMEVPCMSGIPESK